MKIAIFGLPNSGKSRFRRDIVRLVRQFGFWAEHWDADRFDVVRFPDDADCRKPFESPQEDPETVWIIEDVRGTGSGAWKGVHAYDLVFYLDPGFFSHLLFWLSRGRQWFRSGTIDWRRDEGWERETAPRDWRIIPIIAVKIIRQMFMRTFWRKSDREMLRSSGVPVVEIRPCWTRGGGIRWEGFDLGMLIDEVERRVSRRNCR